MYQSVRWKEWVLSAEPKSDLGYFWSKWRNTGAPRMSEWALAGAWSATAVTGKGVLLLSVACQGASMSATLQALSASIWNHADGGRGLWRRREMERGRWPALSGWAVDYDVYNVPKLYFAVLVLGCWERRWYVQMVLKAVKLAGSLQGAAVCQGTRSPDFWLSAESLVGFVAMCGQEPPTLTGRGHLTDMQSNQQ